MTIAIMTAIRNTTDSITSARIQNTAAVIDLVPNPAAIGNRKDTVTKAVFQAMRTSAGIRQEEVAAVIKAVAKTIGVAAGRTNATKAIAKAGTAVMVAQAQNAVTAKV